MKKKFILFMTMLVAMIMALTACSEKETKFTKEEIKDWNVPEGKEPKADDIDDDFVNALKRFIKKSIVEKNYEAFSEMVSDEYLTAVDMTRDEYRALNKETSEALNDIDIEVSDVEASQVDEHAIELRYTLSFNNSNTAQYIYIYKDKDDVFKFAPSMYEPHAWQVSDFDKDKINIQFISLGKVTEGMEVRAKLMSTEKWDRELLSATLYTDRGKYDAAKFKINIASGKTEHALFYFNHAKGKAEKFELVYKGDGGEEKITTFEFK